MHKVYSPKQFFRDIAPELMVEYLGRKGHAFPSSEKDPSPENLYEFWNAIDPVEDRNSMEEDFLDVHGFLQLPNAIDSIHQEANFRKQNPLLFPEFQNQAEAFFARLKSLDFPDDKAFWVMMHQESIFVNAYRFSTADKSAGKSYSTKRPTGYFEKPKDNAEAKRELGKSVSDYFRSKGKGDGHKVDILDRDGVIYYFIYLEDTPKSGGVFKRGEYKKEILRTSFEIVFWFDPKSGELSTCAKGGKEAREELERRFAEICLGNPDLPPLPKKPIYNLDLFKDPKLLLDANEEDGFKSARVKKLRLLPPDSGYEMVLNATDKTEDVRRHLTRFHLGVDGGTIPLSEFKIAHAEIEMVKTKNGSRSEKFEFDLYYPNGCNLGDSPDHRNARACLVRMGVEKGGPPEIVRQVMSAFEQREPIAYLHFHEWPDDALAGLIEQQVLKRSGLLAAIQCSGCEEQPLCQVQFRQEKNLRIPFYTCPQCGLSNLSDEEIQQYRVDADGVAAFIVKELGLKSGPINKQDAVWDIGTHPEGNGQGRVFLLQGPINGNAEKIAKALENENGMCFGLGLSFDRPSQLSDGLNFFSLRRELLIEGKRIRLDTEHIREVHKRFLEKRRPDEKDAFGNSRPPKLALAGNVAERDPKLVKAWREYLKIYSPAVQVYLFESETSLLDWTQAQRARFIFAGSNAASAYNRHLKKLELGPLSGNPEPEKGWFPNPYGRRKRADSAQ